MTTEEVEKKEILHEELSADGSMSGVEFEYDEPFPFDSDKISINNKPVPLETLVRRLKQGSITSPEIQRGAGLWSNEQQSRLIESLMLRIPLPMFYVAADEKEHWKVVDGLQRVTAIRRYVLNQEFRLSGLEFLDSCEGKKFDELSLQFQNRILETEFQFAIIGPSTPENVQRNIFKRLNTGGLPLTPQEIRHALYYGPSTDLLKQLVSSKEFQKATGNSINDSRMAGQELILRFLAFLLFGENTYPKSGDMDSFLSDAMKVINNIISSNSRNASYKIRYTKIDEITDKFYCAMIRAEKIFKDYAFRKSIEGTRVAKTPINKSLFEVWSYVLAEMDEKSFEILMNNRIPLLAKLYSMSYEEKDYNFINSISRDSHKYTGVNHRHSSIKNLINSIVRTND